MKIFFSCLLLVFFFFGSIQISSAKEKFERLVETTQEWKEKAKSVELEKRNIKPYEKTLDKEYLPKMQVPRKFVKYNIPPGGRELDLTKLTKMPDVRSQGVIEPKFVYMAYSEHYFSASNNQISSEIFIQKMPLKLTRMQRALDTNILNTTRKPVISAGVQEFKQNLFNSLTIVDWSKNSSKLLVKEKIGSTITGIYQTYVWIYYMPDRKNKEGYSRKFDEVNEAISNHFAKENGIALNNYRWNITPLGFSKEKPDCVIIEANTWSKNKKPIFLGVWQLNTKNGEITLLSKEPKLFEVSANGIMVKEQLP